jgi:S1-C subfamily serine protease
MRIGLIAAVLVLVVGGLFYWAFFETPEPGFSAESGSRMVPDPAPPPAELAEPEIPVGQAEPEATEPEAVPEIERGPDESSSSGGEETEPAALKGLKTKPLTFDELRREGVPDRFKGGVAISRVAPGSPAAEVALEPGDIIVRGQTQMVESLEDLERIVAGREYTRVMFVRDGRVMQVVLKPPFEPKPD